MDPAYLEGIKYRLDGLFADMPLQLDLAKLCVKYVIANRGFRAIDDSDIISAVTTDMLDECEHRKDDYPTREAELCEVCSGVLDTLVSEGLLKGRGRFLDLVVEKDLDLSVIE